MTNKLTFKLLLMLFVLAGSLLLFSTVSMAGAADHDPSAGMSLGGPKATSLSHHDHSVQRADHDSSAGMSLGGPKATSLSHHDHSVQRADHDSSVVISLGGPKA